MMSLWTLDEYDDLISGTCSHLPPHAAHVDLPIHILPAVASALSDKISAAKRLQNDKKIAHSQSLNSNLPWLPSSTAIETGVSVQKLSNNSNKTRHRRKLLASPLIWQYVAHQLHHGAVVP
jgi:hypothetical protein